MQCENGYTKPGVKGILCRKCEEPKENDLRSVAHALCGHQRFCPKQRCYQFLQSWEKCVLRKAPIGADAPLPPAGEASREEDAGEEIAPKKGKRTAKKKSAEKAATVE